MHLSKNEQIAAEYKTNREPKHIPRASKIIREGRAAVTVRLVSNPLIRTCTADVMFVMRKNPSSMQRFKSS